MCEGTEWGSESAIGCKGGSGKRDGMTVSPPLLVEAWGSLTQTGSYDEWYLSSMVSRNVGGTGAGSVTVWGRRFGEADEASGHARTSMSGY